MLCATVAEKTPKKAIQWARRAREYADLLELRVDHLENPDDMDRVLERVPEPLIVTVRPVSEGGHFRGSPRKRHRLLAEAVNRGVEYISVDQAIPLTERENIGGIQILTYHNHRETPADLSSLLSRYQEDEEADYIKISTYCNNLNDAFRLMDLEPNGTRPIIVTGMGEPGLITRILYRKTSSYMTFGAANPGNPAAEGQPSVRVLSERYRVQKRDPSTDLYGLIGDPVSHSQSPRLFNELFNEHNIDAVYVPLKMQQTRTLGRLLERSDFQGASVTIPHKRTVIPYLDSLNPYAEDIGAVNTIARVDDRFEGYNTDARAAVETLIDCWPEEDVSSEMENPLAGTKVLMLGAGGAARAAGTSLIRAGVDLTLTNRTRERGEELASELEVSFLPWEERETITDLDLLVNCTSVGMKPMSDLSPFPEEHLSPDMVVFDMVYTPAETRLIQAARDAGCHTITGDEMFRRQAHRQFRLWTGIHQEENEGEPEN